MASSLLFVLDRCVTPRRFEIGPFECPRVGLVYDENEEFLHLEVAVGGHDGGGPICTIERIRPDDFYFPRQLSNKIIDIHYFEFKFKCSKDAKVFRTRYCEGFKAYKANNCDVATIAKTFSSSFEIIDPPSSDSDSDSDSDNECSSFCLIKALS